MEFSKEFIHKLRGKDQQAFQSLYLKTRQDLLAYIRYKVRGQEGLVEDILSEVYCRAIEYSHSLTSGHNVMAWLFRIAGSKVADHFRRLKRERKLFYEQKCQNRQEEILNGLSNGPEAATLDSESLLIVRLAFSQLTEDVRKIMCAKYIDDKKTAEIAEEVEKSAKAVENILYRGRKQLQSEIKKISGEKIYVIDQGGAVV